MKLHQLKFAIIALFISILSQNAFSMLVSDAKAKGLVGEQANGYVGIVTPAPSKEVIAMVKEVNSKRREIYSQLAKKQNLTLAAIEEIAGERNIKKTPSGQYIKNSSGSWVTKK
ncbi:MAG TPA: DUF1318 domain-containing protein [Aeromonadales bacterium]|nr:DUF1318 domain-containing protein [Aeromonadales bacterium]